MRILFIIFITLLVYSCESKIEIKNPKNISARVYNTNKYHIGHGLYEHKVMYTYSIDSIRHYGSFIAKDYTKSHSSGYHITDFITIKYDSLNPSKSIFLSFNRKSKNRIHNKLDSGE